MSILVPAFATSNDLTIPAGGAVAAFSQGSFSVLVQNNANANVPPVWSKLADVGASAGVYVSPTFAAGAVVRIDAAGGSLVTVDVGLSPGPKLFRADTTQGTVVTAANAAATLTTAQICGGLITSTGSGIALTLPTGAVMETQGSQAIGEMVHWTLQSNGAGTVTVTAAANHTVSGAGAVVTLTSGRFGTLKTGAGTYVTYRLS